MNMRELRSYVPPVSVDHPAEPSQTIELQRLLAGARRQRLHILLPALGLGIFGLAYGMSKPDTYSATATMLLDDTLNTATRQAGGLGAPSLTPTAAIEDARIVMASNKLAYDVLNTTGLTENATFLDVPSSPISTAIGRTIAFVLTPVTWLKSLVTPAEEPVSAAVATASDETTTDPQQRFAAYLLQRDLNVSRLSQSSAIGITYTSHDPAIASTVANAYADAYRQDLLGANAQAVTATEGWMAERLQQLRQQSQEAAQAAEKFAADNRLAISQDGTLLSEQAQAELNASLTAAIGDRAKAQAILSTYDDVLAGGVEGLLDGNSISFGSDQLPEQLLSRLDNFNGLQSRLRELTINAGPNHPQIAGLKEALQTSAGRLFVELQARRQTAASDLNVAKARVDALRATLDEMTAQNAGQAAALVRLKSMQQEAQTLSTLYQQTLAGSQEIRQQSSFPVANVRVLSYAETPRQPSGPATLRYAIAAGMLGLFFGLCWAIRRETRQSVLRTANDLTAYSPLRFLGHLPPLRSFRGSHAPQIRAASHEANMPIQRPLAPSVQIPVLQQPNSIYAETLRHVRLAAQGQSDGAAVVAVTSFNPYHGRASVTLNLAGQIAATSKKRVLVIDTDSREGTLTRLLRLDSKPGFAEGASSDDHWQSMLLDVEDANLTVLPAGKGIPDDLQSAQLIRRILNEVRGEFAAIVVDVPALYPTAQGLAMLYELPSFAVVGEWGETPRDVAEAALLNHPLLESLCLGVVYDRVNLRKLRSFTTPNSVERMLVEA
ncbi:GNVR domain-containing protein [Falsirhodobacter sp. 20TX0035]|uniref:GNVR domain-containing protein n=1 Tax=Falsirhodobacter sp. 20TX0035 TaxID=3022019 RepID=UPI00232CF81C|nr:GNVR domain-containing protein [Falsirhodobacter sp. 20TX0035]MDB6454797.1 GNVR domain-containing protein [Falsirhodobacter sp. 20TX0035]